MRREALLVAAFVLDQLVGDPEGMPHPVRWMGAGISRGERALRWRGQGALTELLAGAGLAVAVVGAAYWASLGAIRVGYACGEAVGSGFEVVLGSTCLAGRNLGEEAGAVTAALECGDLAQGRVRLGRIVGRDTQELDAGEISRAVVETVAESASDGMMAPMVYMALGGVPLAMAYKAVNTLDSMIGHADGRYFWFGKAAARLDDLANLVPARLTALGIVGAAGLGGGDATAAWRIWRRDGGLHKSPNAGQPESAMAGALGVRLGGANRYAGEVVEGPCMGAEFRGPALRDAERATGMVALVGVLGLVVCMVLARLTRRAA